MAKNLDEAKKTLELVRQFRNEMTIILHTSEGKVDNQTKEVFERAYHVSASAANQMGLLIDELESKTIPTQP